MDVHSIKITHIGEVLTVFSPKGRRLSVKCRKYYGLSFCASGKIEYVRDGVRTVSDRTCAVILPKGASYELYGTETGDFPLINFYTAENFTDDFISIPLRNVEPYLRDCERLKELWKNPQDHARLMSLIYDILDRLSREESKTRSLLSPALNYLYENLSDPTLSNASLALVCNVSEVYLRKLFLSELGATPKQYIIDLRIRHAKLMLS